MTRQQFNFVCRDFFNIISNIQEKDGNELGYTRTDILDAFLKFYDDAQEIFDYEEEKIYNNIDSKDYKFGFNYTASLMRNKEV
jgi:hypothetical protein